MAEDAAAEPAFKLAVHGQRRLPPMAEGWGV
jgi:hypothetical protein